MREWKPGDVVAATVNGRTDVRLVAGWSRYEPRLRWCELSPRWGDGDDDECWFMPHSVTDIRPLVVIDPEDREQVERLMDAYTAHDSTGLYNTSGVLSIDHMQAALREFANPTRPKPAEPTGLGAVVEDAEGERWVRVNQRTGTQEWRCCDFNGEFRNWPDIAAVRVLSEGVSDVR